MSEMTSRRAETEGRRGSRIDTDEGGRYVGIPLNGQCSVQETGCGTLDANRDEAGSQERLGGRDRTRASWARPAS